MPVQSWNRRAVRGAIIRLEQTGFIKRVRALKKGSTDRWLVCVKLLREPADDDIKNLGFRRVVPETEHAEDEPLDDDDVEAESFMRDMEIDIMGSENDDETGKAARVLPQWTPDRLLSNLVFDAVEQAGVDGGDAATIRDMSVGRFWKRPLESYLSRLTDNWETSQPPHLRHLAIIRDTGITREKKFVHFIYRTHGNFQKGVDAGEVQWEAVVKEDTKGGQGEKRGRPRKVVKNTEPLDSWGFQPLNVNDFHRRNGSSTLAECRSGIVHARRHGQHWDNRLTQILGYQKPGKARHSIEAATPIPQEESEVAESKQAHLEGSVAEANGHSTFPSSLFSASRTKSRRDTSAVAFLTVEQRQKLGLPLKGRLSEAIEEQIRAYRREIGDSTAIPDAIVTDEGEPVIHSRRPQPILTREERIARGLPERGRLGKDLEDQIRREKGMTVTPSRPKKERKKPLPRGPPLLTKEQRIARGLPATGRLPNSLIEQLRRERDMRISNPDPALPAGGGGVRNTVEMEPREDLRMSRNDSGEHDGPLPLQLVAASAQPKTPPSTVESQAVVSGLIPGKRPAESQCDNSRSTPKRPRLRSDRPRKSPLVQGSTIDVGPHEVSIPSDGTLETPISVSTPTPDDRQGREATPLTKLTAVDQGTAVSSPALSATSLHAGEKETLPVLAQSFIAHGTAPSPAVTSQKPIRKSAGAHRSNDMYANRAEPGLYIDPYATRSAKGRGRPRKAFMATFKSPRLLEFPWFTLGSAHATTIGPFTPSATREKGHLQSKPSSANIMSERQTPPTTPTANARIEVAQPPAYMNLEEMPQNETPQVETPRVQTPGTESEPILERPGAHRPSTDAVEHMAAQTPSVHNPDSFVGTVQPKTPDNSLPQQMTEQIPPVSVDWTAINAPIIAPLGGPVAQVPTDYPNSDTVDGPSIREAPIAGERAVLPTLRSPATGSRSRQKKPNPYSSRGVVIGKGNVWRARLSIINHILELCGGVFPGNGEIIPIFEEVWKERAPKKIICPERSTLSKALKEMISNPDSNLKRLVYKVPSIEGGLPVDRAVIAYKHLAPDSPEVKKVLDGIMQAYPSRYWPPEIRHYVKEETRSRPGPMPEKDATIQLDAFYPPTAQRLERSIKESVKRRNQEEKKKRAQQAEVRRVNNSELERVLPNTDAEVPDTVQPKRTRLISLNDNSQSKRAVPREFTFKPVEESEVHSRVGSRDYTPSSLSDSEDDIPLAQLYSIRHRTMALPDASSSHDRSTLTPDSTLHLGHDYALKQPSQSFRARDAANATLSAFITPVVQFCPSNGTFSTIFQVAKKDQNVPERAATPPNSRSETAQVQGNGVKRVRIEESFVEQSRKRSRPNDSMLPSEIDGLYVQSESSSTDESSDEETVPRQQKGKRQKSVPDVTPTLVERLAGLTGNPNDPDYQPPKKKQKTFPTWIERKERARIRRLAEKKWPESTDPVDQFKKVCCALVVASSMSGEDGVIDWNIITRVYKGDRNFGLEKMKKTWSWIQENMMDQFGTLTESFQSSFLEAYENGEVASIDDPENYDWANLVRWMLQHCPYPEAPLPMSRMALRDYEVDLSNYEVLDRPSWYRDNITYLRRAQCLLNSTFGAPLHQPVESTKSDEEPVLKGRSWIRATIATSKALYNKRVAHDKLRLLSDSVLEGVVSEFVQSSFIRQWKIKKQKPGRNYNFTSAFAKNYRRLFELSDFMDAVKFKKSLDLAFSSDDPDKRTFSISRSADDGTVMAILTLVGDGRIKLVPRLPPINSDFAAPLPRLSVWGFCEGDYTHRAIDRQRMFWPVDVVPTSAYAFGNPIQPVPFPLAPKADGTPADWPPLLEPPLPGRDNPDALLPIWSSIDGQSVTWPWWNRILNLILQTLIFQPGITAAEILRQCPKYTTEDFEVELVLHWLQSVKAIKQTRHGTFEVAPGFWAAFGDRLIDDTDDEFGEHVRRKPKNKKLEPTWRSGYNLRFSTLQRAHGASQQASTSDDGAETDGEAADDGTVVGEQIFRRAKKQYSIARNALNGRGSQTTPAAAADPQSSQARNELPIDPALEEALPARDVAMADLETDAEGEEVDAEGEVDDEML